ncbi:MAG: fatty acid desaturase [Hyphomicrobiaceae bacterium]|nr:fatty acid desaturase [Hyphomicrobiaceae bacterium]
MQILGPYREPNQTRSVLEIAITAGPFVLLWIASWAALSVSYWLSLAIATIAAGFLVRLFMIQHDCGHGALFRKRIANDWVGRVIGVVTLTPYDVWRRNHAIHHASSGNLDRRGIGDIQTLTVREYRALPLWRRLAYRIYRHPVVMFGIGPAYLFMLQHRLPVGLMRAGWRPWITSMGTNLGIALVVILMMWLVGAGTFLLVHLPIMLLASSIGVWLFYVQHQFEDTFWAEGSSWSLPDAALQGSSYYDLPMLLRWMTANIGIHHVHHLYSGIPYYRLPEVLRDHPDLAAVSRMTLTESLRCVRLRLWDESTRRLVSFREARQHR